MSANTFTIFGPFLPAESFLKLFAEYIIDTYHYVTLCLAFNTNFDQQTERYKLSFF